ncbi:mRNA processing-related protein [Thraustotheca clavata]|uniref:Pre-mRNA-splicing factor SLU7 n=1 Tax=Thraustotheca clavata TaxID=74557 RepID=A0A1W0A966_9STRA|nr:mRNA processing-related protein [Thraustotheca clavata]
MNHESSDRMSASDFRKKKEIDEARKNGTLPPEKDAEGNLINPHNPDYISKRPWYLGDSGPSLKHQINPKKDQVLTMQQADELNLRAFKQPTTARRKFRKGACTNCGAMTHNAKECVERPRKIGAWKTNKDIAPDEVIVDVRSGQYGKLTFDAKRDAWLGYDAEEHQATIERHERLEQERKKKRIEEMNEELIKDDNQKKTKKNSDDSDSDSDGEGSEDEEFVDKEGGRVIAKRVSRQGGVGGAEMKITARNLRIREDTAKYLRNLNSNSAFYDPKTRSMRDNPNPDLSTEDSEFMGDNFIRNTGDAVQLAKTQLFAWEAAEHGVIPEGQLHPQATPSAAEFMRQQYEQKKAALEREKRKAIIDKYGEQTKAPPKELLLAATETYVEYSRDGRVVKGVEKAPVKSKYLEDVLENNHTQIWGSWYDCSARAWGFACCHSKVRKSYCTGEEGKLAQKASAEASSLQQEPAKERELLAPSGKESTFSLTSRSDLYGENTAPTLDAEKLKQAKAKAKTKQKKMIRNESTIQCNKMNAEDMEIYRMQMSKREDPMANIGSDTLLPE